MNQEEADQDVADEVSEEVVHVQDYFVPMWSQRENLQQSQG